MNGGAIRAAAVGVVVSVAAAAVLLWTVDVDRTLSVLGGAELLWIAPALAILAVQAVVRALRWRLLLGAMAGRPLRIARVLEPMLIGYLVNATAPGRLGEVARAVLLARREAIGVGTAAASVIVERAVDLAGLLLLATLALAAAGSDGAWPLAAGGAVVAAAILLGRRAPTLERLVPSFLPRRVAGVIHDVLAAIARTPRRALLVAGSVSAAAWLVDGTLAWMAGRAIGVELPVAAAVAIGLGGAIGSALPAAPGYLATYELGAVAFGTLAGVSAEVVLPLAVLVHVLGVGSLAFAGAVSLGRVGGAMAVGLPRRGSLSDLSHEAG